MESVFISHSWSDKPLARKIAQTLHGFAIKVWLDEAEIKLGDSLIEKIRDGIDSVDYVLALLSAEAINSEWVKKELDVAMNQEIEGKKVKVLPVLAERCELPGFLKGKLYADMSTERKFNAALPMLLSRFGVDHNILRKLNDGESLDKLIKGTKDTLDIANALHSDNANVQYKVLKSIEKYKHKEVIQNAQVLEALVSLLEPVHSTHIRLEAFKVIGYLEDSNFSDVVFNHIEDDNFLVSRRAIETLTELDASEYGNIILSILCNEASCNLHNSCLDFFSKVTLENEADSISAVSAIQSHIKARNYDVGVHLRSAHAICNQWNGNSNQILEYVLELLDSESSSIRKVATERVKELATSEELWIDSLEHKERLVKAITRLYENNSTSEKIAAWLIGFLWYDFDRDIVWHSILNSSEIEIEALIDKLEIDYNIEYIFNSKTDVERIKELIDCCNSHNKQKLLGLVAQINNQSAIELLVENNYSPKKFFSLSVLKTLIELDDWNSRYSNLLDICLSDYPNDNLSLAFSLLAKHKAEMISTENLANLFPRKDYPIFRSRQDLYKLKKYLEKLKKVTDSKLQRRILTLIKSIEKYEDGSY